ncbi:hypothetical protein [Bradyrhizobium sp. 164]|uniref:hypothetical protein n=1 Tax=Bradyrhizobium sp. 164 TaxID=2782637 RepID=UPI001FF9AD7B|nr:hypothetical protein [Bradyrhizobium sp. 164]MCK1593331.1 hypothetical protein [Bradyrhizobium sp. 164]
MWRDDQGRDDGAMGSVGSVCGKRLNVMIPVLLPALEQHGRLKPGLADRDRVFAITPATIDRLRRRKGRGERR